MILEISIFIGSFLVSMFFFDYVVKKTILKQARPIFIYDNFLPKLIHVEAIAIFPMIYCRGKKIDYLKRPQFKRLVTHELIHFKQVLNSGWLLYHCIYGILFCYLMTINCCNFQRAHDQNPYEKEAYLLENEKITSLFTKKQIENFNLDVPFNTS